MEEFGLQGNRDDIRLISHGKLISDGNSVCLVFAKTGFAYDMTSPNIYGFSCRHFALEVLNSVIAYSDSSPHSRIAGIATDQFFTIFRK